MKAPQNCSHRVVGLTTAHATVPASPISQPYQKSQLSTKSPEMVTTGYTKQVNIQEGGTGGNRELGAGDFHPLSLWNRQVAFHP